jgi:hypothetical protein
MDQWFRESVDAVVRCFAPKIPVHQSGLDADPVF